MRIAAGRVPFIVLFIIFLFLPFFEGGETAVGLFLIHTFTLFALLLTAVTHSRIWIPKFLLYFLPFFGALLVSTAIAPYKYSAFLQLWDYSIAGIATILFFSVLKENKDQSAFLIRAFFLASSVALIASVLVSPMGMHTRIKGSIVNPNDFACYTLLMVLYGLFLWETESEPTRKRIVSFTIVLFAVCIALSASRSAFLAGCLFALLYLWRRKPGKTVFVGITLALLFCSGILLYRFHNPDPFQYYRLRIWKHSLEGILNDPYLGVGLNMLPYHAARFNFPGDNLLGRYAFLATTADNQYLQILAETGFLGLFTFLVGWLTIPFLLNKTSKRYLVLRLSIVVVSVIAFFSLPLENTAIQFLFLFLIVLPLSLDSNGKSLLIALHAAGRIALCVLTFVLFSAAVYLPYAADREFKAAIRTTDLRAAQEHLTKAVLYNPYQPYYRFAFIKRAVDSNPLWKPADWLKLIGPLNDSIRLNPLESDFYAYRARIYVILAKQTEEKNYYSQAVSSYQAALDRSPNNVFLRIQFASFLAQWGRMDLAETETQKALEAEPVFLHARFLLARIRAERRDPAGARAVFTEAERYYSRFRNARIEPGDLYKARLLSIDPKKIEEIRARVFSTDSPAH